MIRIVIAAETMLLRQLLFDALNGRCGITVLATASDAAHVIALVKDLETDVVLVSMRVAAAPDLVMTLLDKQTKVVALGRCDSDGASCVEDGSVHDVVAAVHGSIHGASASPRSSSSDLDRVTPTERRVLRLVNEGLSNKEIAREMGIAVSTVKHHVHSLLNALGVRRRGQAAAIFRDPHMALRNGNGSLGRSIERSCV